MPEIVSLTYSVQERRSDGKIVLPWRTIQSGIQDPAEAARLRDSYLESETAVGQANALEVRRVRVLVETVD